MVLRTIFIILPAYGRGILVLIDIWALALCVGCVRDCEMVGITLELEELSVGLRLLGDGGERGRERVREVLGRVVVIDHHL